MLTVNETRHKQLSSCPTEITHSQRKGILNISRGTKYAASKGNEYHMKGVYAPAPTL